MKSTVLALALLLTGCGVQEFCAKHEKACAIGATCAVTSVGLSFHGHGSHSSGTGPTPDFTTLPVHCGGASCQ